MQALAAEGRAGRGLRHSPAGIRCAGNKDIAGCSLRCAGNKDTPPDPAGCPLRCAGNKDTPPDRHFPVQCVRSAARELIRTHHLIGTSLCRVSPSAAAGRCCNATASVLALLSTRASTAATLWCSRKRKPLPEQ
jgi:hypothetical protein